MHKFDNAFSQKVLNETQVPYRLAKEDRFYARLIIAVGMIYGLALILATTN